jgi:hypothetical protein
MKSHQNEKFVWFIAKHVNIDNIPKDLTTISKVLGQDDAKFW